MGKNVKTIMILHSEGETLLLDLRTCRNRTMKSAGVGTLNSATAVAFSLDFFWPQRHWQLSGVWCTNSAGFGTTGRISVPVMANSAISGIASLA